MIAASIAKDGGQYVLSLQDYYTSNTEAEAFVLRHDDLVMLRNIIDTALRTDATTEPPRPDRRALAEAYQVVLNWLHTSPLVMPGTYPTSVTAALHNLDAGLLGDTRT